MIKYYNLHVELFSADDWLEKLLLCIFVISFYWKSVHSLLTSLRLLPAASAMMEKKNWYQDFFMRMLTNFGQGYGQALIKGLFFILAH